ncbi:hypothetical protein Tco_0270222 [Tanacetum coccineum]
MNEFQKDEKVQELKIQPIDYEKLNKLYFVPQKELSEISVKQTCSSSSYIPFVKILETKTMHNLVITSCMEIRNKDLHDEIERISKESNDVSFEVTQGLSKRIVELEKDLSKSEAKKNLKSQLFEFAKTKFDNILEKIEFFKKKQLDISELNMGSGENVCDNAKYELQTKIVVDDSKAKTDQFLKEINHLRNQLENLKGTSVKTNFDKHSILGKPPADKLLINSQISKSWFTPKVDMQKSLSKPVTAQSLPKNEKDQLLKRIAYLESKLASQDIRSCQKEYHELRTLYNALKVKFDSLNRKKRETNVSKSSKPRESVSAKVHTGESSKPFSRRVSQFTTYSFQKDRKFSKNSQSFETLTPQKGFKKRASNAKHQSFETTYSCFTPEKQVWRPIKESQTFEASTSQKSFKTRTLKGNNQVFDPHSRFTPVKQVWRPKQSHLKTFKYSKLEMFSLQNKNDLALKNRNNGRLSNASTRKESFNEQFFRMFHQMTLTNGNLLRQQDLKLHLKHRVSKINGISRGILNLC